MTHLHPMEYHQDCNTNQKRNQKQLIQPYSNILIYRNKINNISKHKWRLSTHFVLNLPKYHGIPEHNIVVLGSPTDACRRVLLQPFKISHQPLPCRCRHRHHLQTSEIQSKEKSKSVVLHYSFTLTKHIILNSIHAYLFGS